MMSYCNNISGGQQGGGGGPLEGSPTPPHMAHCANNNSSPTASGKPRQAPAAPGPPAPAWLTPACRRSGRRRRGGGVARALHRRAAAPRVRAVGRHPALPAAQLRRAQPRLLTAAPRLLAVRAPPGRWLPANAL